MWENIEKKTKVYVIWSNQEQPAIWNIHGVSEWV